MAQTAQANTSSNSGGGGGPGNRAGARTSSSSSSENGGGCNNNGGGVVGSNGIDRKRVKVYELKNNDWYDRGTGFCTGQLAPPSSSSPESLDARIIVVSEEDPSRTLLETRITKDDGYQKQQETLIVWTELTGVDMALSFQEAEGCAGIWKFVSEVQHRLTALAPDDALSDDLLDSVNSIVLPEPSIERLDEIEATIRAAASTPAGRDSLAKFVMHPEHLYIMKLAPLVGVAEGLESVADLHKLCTIMKNLILINDTSIIEFVVTDQAIMGVVGALEYDPDFPSHRANHRQYLADSSKFKQVVPIEDPEIRRKIHWTYRLLYLKDVVLARILDDPTFSVLNSLIFFHQVDIVNHLQSNHEFLQELFAIFDSDRRDLARKKEAVLFIQNCCAVSKNIQPQNRAQLYARFINYGLFAVITFALRHHDASVRVAGTDILVALIDHDPHLVRSHIFMAMKDQQTLLTDTLIELLLVEVDLGVKSQMADALKVLLDPISSAASIEMMNRTGNGDMQSKQRGTGGAGGAGGAGGQGGGQGAPQHQMHQNPQILQFIDDFYDKGAVRLFAPLKALEHRRSMAHLSPQETSLFTHLVEVLCFFVRQHHHRCKGFILGEHLHCRIAQLLSCPQKFMKLAALKWFRTCIALQDEFHNRQMIQYDLFSPILQVVEETMPRDNLLNSACLELFEHIKRESSRQIIFHLVERYRYRLLAISYVNTFQALVVKYDQLKAPSATVMDDSFSTQEGTPQRTIDGRQVFSGLKEMDTHEEAYFDAEDDVEDDDDVGLPTLAKHHFVNGASPVRPLVDYPDDDEYGPDLMASSPDILRDKKSSSDDRRAVTDPGATVDPMDDDEPTSPNSELLGSERGRNRTPVPVQCSPGLRQRPPELLATKRRRTELDEEDDELGKMMGGIKRRNSSLSGGGDDGKLDLQQTEGANPDPDEIDSESQSQHQRLPNQARPVIRRKSSLKLSHDKPHTQSTVSIKPIMLSSNSDALRSSNERYQQINQDDVEEEQCEQKPPNMAKAVSVGSHDPGNG